jgi:poly(hydroxyalkanoate) granule-associated protein
MVKKLQKLSSKKADTTNPVAATIKDSAQQIWLAGLGAFAKAQQEGGKVFETLVKEGLSMQKKTQVVAEERISGATAKVTTMANDIGQKASGQWDKLETIFEDRVARTLNKLGVPSSQDIEALIVRIDALNQSVKKLQPAAAKTTEAKVAAPKAVAAKPVAARKAATPKADAAPKARPSRSKVATATQEVAAAESVETV